MSTPKDDFLIDPPTKLGASVEWESGEDFNAFVDSLNTGRDVRSNGLERVSELPRENELDEDSLLQLKHIFSNYR